MRLTIERDKRYKRYIRKPQRLRVAVPVGMWDERIIAGRNIIRTMRLRP